MRKAVPVNHLARTVSPFPAQKHRLHAGDYRNGGSHQPTLCNAAGNNLLRHIGSNCIMNQYDVIKAFQQHPEIDQILVVCIEGWQEILWAYARQFGITKLKWVITGGETGHESIRNGVYELGKPFKLPILPVQIFMRLHPFRHFPDHLFIARHRKPLPLRCTDQ